MPTPFCKKDSREGFFSWKKHQKLGIFFYVIFVNNLQSKPVQLPKGGPRKGGNKYLYGLDRLHHPLLAPQTISTLFPPPFFWHL